MTSKCGLQIRIRRGAGLVHNGKCEDLAAGTTFPAERMNIDFKTRHADHFRTVWDYRNKLATVSKRFGSNFHAAALQARI